MFSLKLVFGQVVDTIRTAGPVVLLQDFLIGGNNNTVEQAKPVAQESKPKRKAVKQASQAQSPTVKTSPVRTPTKKSKVIGTSQDQLVPPSAKLKPKSSKKVAKKVTKVSSATKDKKSAPKVRGQVGK